MEIFTSSPVGGVQAAFKGKNLLAEGATLKGKNLLLLGANSSLLE